MRLEGKDSDFFNAETEWIWPHVVHLPTFEITIPNTFANYSIDDILLVNLYVCKNNSFLGVGSEEGLS